MGLWAVAFLGSTPIGGPLMGWVGETLGARWALGLGGVAVLVAVAAGSRITNANERGSVSADTQPETVD